MLHEEGLPSPSSLLAHETILDNSGKVNRECGDNKRGVSDRQES
jgi:hypothetical protein